MNETERKQIKPQLLKCADENENKVTFTGYVIVSKVCRAAVERIEELEKENAELKSVAEFQQSSNMKRHFEIQELKKKNAKLESDFRICEKNADTYYDQLTKAKEHIRTLISCLID